MNGNDLGDDKIAAQGLQKDATLKSHAYQAQTGLVPVAPATWKAKTEDSHGPGSVRSASVTTNFYVLVCVPMCPCLMPVCVNILTEILLAR